MGLLSGLFDGEDGRMALGLLAAGGPTTDPNRTGLGARLSEAVGSVDQYRKAKAQDEFQKMQMDNYKSEIEQRRAAMAKQAQMQEMLQGFMQGNGGPGLTQGGGMPSMGGGSGLSAGGVSSASQSAPSPITGNSGGDWLSNLQPGQLAALKINGVDLTDVYKLTRPNLTNVNGTLVDASSPKNADRYVGDPTKGFSYKDGNVGVLPGYLDANNSIEGGKAAATERAKANWDPLTITPAGSTNPVMSTRGALLGGNQGGASGGGYNGGSASAAKSGQLEILQQELRKPNLSSDDRASLMREISRLGATQPTQGAPSSGGIRLQSPSEAAQLLDQVKADIQPTQAKAANIDSAQNAYDLVNKALAHPGLSTATGISGTLDPRNYIPGTDAKNFSSISKQLQGNAFLSAFASLKGGGAITEVEGAKAESAIARLQTAQSEVEYRSALGDYQKIIGQGLKRMGVDVGAASAPAPAANVPQAAANMLKMKPSLRADFDAKYGPGSADRILGVR